ncbi:MAG TPA: ABC transporter substrate-binding protein [Dehalococcoidia bacterium]|nr:ABC transporter substrate-binding protein [Dehalococcoidia bacterium]
MKKYLMWALTLTLVLSLLAIGGIGCEEEGEEEPTPTPEVTATPVKEAYKVGAILDLSGPCSNLGIPEERTAEMMADQVNAAGGINGHPLEVIIYDTEGDSTKSVTLVTKLIEEDEVLAIIGPSRSGSSGAVIDTVTTSEIPIVSLAAARSIVVPVEERYWVFKTPQTEYEIIPEIYTYLQSADITDVAIISDTGGFGVAGRTLCNDLADDYGITIVDDQTFADADTSMISQMTHIKGENPQAVVCWSTDKGSAIVAQDMKTLQMDDVLLFMSHGVANKAFVQAGGEAVEGVIIPAGKLLAADEVPADDPQKEVLVSYRDDYEAIYGAGSIDTFGGHCYDGLSWVIMALEEMPEGLTLADARAFIRDAIEDMGTFIGTGGVYNITAEDHLGLGTGNVYMYEIVNGEWVWFK